MNAKRGLTIGTCNGVFRGQILLFPMWTERPSPRSPVPRPPTSTPRVLLKQGVRDGCGRPLVLCSVSDATVLRPGSADTAREQCPRRKLKASKACAHFGHDTRPSDRRPGGRHFTPEPAGPLPAERRPVPVAASRDARPLLPRGGPTRVSVETSPQSALLSASPSSASCHRTPLSVWVPGPARPVAPGEGSHVFADRFVRLS